MNGSARHGAQGDPATLFGWGMKHRADPLFRGKGSSPALPVWLVPTTRPSCWGRNELIGALTISTRGRHETHN